MSRIRRRATVDRRAPELTDAQRRHQQWRRDAARRRLDAALLPAEHPDAIAAMADAIRERKWSNGVWDRLRASGMAPAEAREMLGSMVPPWVAL